MTTPRTDKELLALGQGITPGLWEARRNRVHVKGQGNLATVENPWNNEKEREANTRAIAAVPELLARLETLIAERDALAALLEQRTEALQVRIDTICDSVTGSEYLEVARIEREDDGSRTVVVVKDCRTAQAAGVSKP